MPFVPVRNEVETMLVQTKTPVDIWEFILANGFIEAVAKTNACAEAMYETARHQQAKGDVKYKDPLNATTEIDFGLYAAQEAADMFAYLMAWSMREFQAGRFPSGWAIWVEARMALEAWGRISRLPRNT